MTTWRSKVRWRSGPRYRKFRMIVVLVKCVCIIYRTSQNRRCSPRKYIFLAARLASYITLVARYLHANRDSKWIKQWLILFVFLVSRWPHLFVFPRTAPTPTTSRNVDMHANGMRIYEFWDIFQRFHIFAERTVRLHDFPTTDTIKNV